MLSTNEMHTKLVTVMGVPTLDEKDYGDLQEYPLTWPHPQIILFSVHLSAEYFLHLKVLLRNKPLYSLKHHAFIFMAPQGCRFLGRM